MARISKAGGKKTKTKARKASPAKGRKTAKTNGRKTRVAAPRKGRPIVELTKELDKALARQDATAEILKVISASPTDVKSVFDAICATAARLFNCDLTGVFWIEGASLTAITGAFADRLFERHEFAPDMPLAADHNFPAMAAVERRTVHVPNYLATQLPAHEQYISDRYGIKCGLYLPLLRNSECIGVFLLTASKPDHFSGQDIAVAESFRDQALIAIQNARLFNETKEALERQTAAADILRIISRSVAHAAPVFDTILESCQRLFNPYDAAVYLVEGDRVRGVARRGAGAGGWGADSMPLEGSSTGAAIAQRQPVHFPDLADKADLPEDKRAVVKAAGGMTVLYAPIISESRGVGSLVVTRRPRKPFTETEIEFIQSFADQAAIAIENARLFDEVQASTRGLSEALEQQTATSEVLAAISRSPSNLNPVLEAISDTAARLCGSEQTMFFRYDGNVFRILASWNFPPEVHEMLERRPLTPGHPSAIGRAGASLKPVCIPDVLADPDYGLTGEQSRARYRATLAVPLLREGRLIGALSLNRSEPGAFTEKQIELVATFADQAVIAIENVRLFDEVQAKTSDLEESLQQQIATADVLKVISRSAFDLQTVLETLARSAVELSSARRGTVFLRDGDVFRFRAASHPDLNEDWIRFMKANPLQAGRHSTIGRAIASARSVCTPDVEADPEIRMPTHLAGIRAVLAVPLLRDGKVEGVMAMSRQEPGEFTARQVELVETFADQAVIAIENTRLFNETKQALAYQTGSSNVLRVIASSPTDVEPVLKEIVESARELCEANDAVVLLRDAEHLRFSAHSGPIPVTIDKWPISRNWTAGRAFVDQKPVHVHDMLSGDGAEFPDARAMGQSTGSTIHTVLSVPLLRGNESIGAILLRRTEVRPFNDKQINLLSTFADQAVIAIQNARLFNETREALERQTATAEILKVIASSPDDVQPVFQAIAERSNHLVGGFATIVVSIVDDIVHLSAFTSTTPAADAALRAFYPRPLSGFSYSDAVRRGEIHRIVDAELELAAESDQLTMVRQRGWRSALWVPLLLEGEAIGVIGVTRVEPGPFADHHVDMLETFADQAVIAISNVKLFRQVQERTRDLEESLQQQTATSEVLQVISRSVFDLKTVLQTLLESAASLCDASICILFQSQGDLLHVGASYGGTPEFVEYLSNHPHRFDRATVAGRAAVERRTIHIPDIAADAEYGLPQSIKLGGWQSIIGVPLLRDGEVLGVLDLARPVAGPFTPRQIKLIETFADQAVIAIENARLFDEVQQRTKELAASLDDLRTAQDRLVQTEKLASLGQLTAGIAHEIKNPLNFVNNFAALSSELIDEMTEMFENPALDEAGRRKELDEIRELLKSNLEKVVQHGKRADSIVKNMLLHSREGSGEQRAVDINALLDESLNLAYHGARAEKPGFNITLQRDLDPDAGVVELFPQEITRALLNLISNGFYAASKREAENGEADFEPVLGAATKNLGNHIEIRIRDNGTGIPPEVKEKMFNPFFTTKPAGEGTGLGLSMSHDIIVKQHGGRIEVDTQPGQFTEFTIVLPRATSPANNRDDLSASSRKPM
ncbi:GAF domain-containing protein [Bradyrhizobium commune]|uniref:histidine kinase n=1 Tax=Bradyrhizobium commune TaxID=83627 RepID=A0A7S9D620_9BRAD|nr:GAF domain-containing protein [Bradyrhizobium commune]QPF91099.1 GAF domain-containing protein [Bradyrhizobium commune]